MRPNAPFARRTRVIDGYPLKVAVGTVTLPIALATALMPGTLRAADEAVLEEISVTADRQGSFSADFVQAGTFRNARQIDTPLTVAVIPKDLLDAQQALTLSDATRNTAGVTTSQINSTIYGNLAIRGVPADNTTNYRLNGFLPIINLVDMPLENKDRVEVLKGASGLYYGFATPAGIVNLTTKRPAAEPLTAVRVLGNSHGSIGGELDVSRSFGTSGLRVDAAAAKLETGLDWTKGDRRFASAAYDWKPNDRFVLELDAEYIYKTITEPTEFALPAPVNDVITLPPLQDADKNLGGEWMQARGEEYNVLGRAQYRLSPHWSASFGAGVSSLSRDRRYSSFGGYDLASGNGTVNVAMTAGNDFEGTIFRGDLAGAFRTGQVEHELVVGVSQYERRTFIPTAVRVSFSQNIYNPVPIPEQPTPSRVIPNPSKVTDLGYYVMDRAQLTDWLQLLLGYRRTDYEDVSRTTSYKASPDTLSYGVLVKPKDWISLYATYIEGLEPGGIAQQIARNAGEILPAAISEQRELGVKIKALPGLLVTAAWFDIDRASSYLNSNNFFVRDGRANYRGVELSATGELTSSLSVAVSAISLDAVQDSGAAAIVGKRIENTAEFTGSVFLEYRIPYMQGLRLSAGAFHTGSRAVNAANNAFVPGYTTYDLGASYTSELNEHPVVYRITGENITGVKYWAATGSSLLAQGLPGSIKLSVSTSF